MKILFWLLIIGCVIAGLQAPGWLVVAGLFIVGGPLVAVPAMLAVRGKQVESTRSTEELNQVVDATFGQDKVGRKWDRRADGPGALNLVMKSTKAGREPMVSLNFVAGRPGVTVVSVWMSEWTSGGLNGGKGTPFWVWGGNRALSKVAEVAEAVR